MSRLIFKKYLFGLIIVCLVFSGMFFTKPQKAQAIFGMGDIVIDPSNLVQNTVTAVTDVKSWIKDFVLDTAAWILNNVILQQITQDTVNWINSGFEGNPAFVTNPGQMLDDAAQQASGKFFADFGLTGLCAPFRVKLNIALRSQRTFNQRMQCTIDRVISNYQNFIDDFSNGGWAGWIAITQPQNNIYGAYLEGANELSQRQQEAQSMATLETSWGSGFLSLKDKNGNIITPGGVIEKRLNEVLGTDVRRIEVAGKINQIITSLLNQLVTSVVRNLRGSGGGNVPRDNTPVPQDVKRGAIDTIDYAIATEQGYADTKQKTSALIDILIDKLEKLKDCYKNKNNSTKVAEIDTSIAGLKTQKADIAKDISNSKILMIEADEYKIDINSASTYEAVSSVLNDFDDVMQPKLHTTDEISKASEEYSAISTGLDDTNAEINLCTGATP
jgi:hypothetical protein